MKIERIISQLKRHEGSVKNDEGRHIVYEDSVGVPTVGFGRNLQDRGLSENEAENLLRNDIVWFDEKLKQRFPVVQSLKEERQEVLLNLAFNLGLDGLASFANMWDAIRRASYGEAAQEMLDSRWAEQVGYRAEELAEIMRRGKYPEDPNQETGEGC